MSKRKRTASVLLGLSVPFLLAFLFAVMIYLLMRAAFNGAGFFKGIGF